MDRRVGKREASGGINGKLNPGGFFRRDRAEESGQSRRSGLSVKKRKQKGSRRNREEKDRRGASKGEKGGGK